MEFDIAKNIKLIEMLKAQMLAAIAELYNSLACNESDIKKQGDILADLIIITYMLGEKIGVSFNSVDLKAIKKLKIGTLNEEEALYKDAVKLLKYMYINN